VSARTLRISMIVLTLIGLGVASYLTYIHYAGIKPLCGKNGGSCQLVQTSVYSRVAGVPVALVGLIGYVAILASLLAPESERSRLVTTVLILGGFGFSAYLTYREVFSLHHICEWCLSSAIIMAILLVLTLWRFLRGDPAPAAPAAAAAREPAESGAAFSGTS
jgi:uncharacterized membrane protein